MPKYISILTCLLNDKSMYCIAGMWVKGHVGCEFYNKSGVRASGVSLGIRGPQLRPPLKALEYHGSMVPRGLGEAYINFREGRASRKVEVQKKDSSHCFTQWRDMNFGWETSASRRNGGAIEGLTLKHITVMHEDFQGRPLIGPHHAQNH